jgi:aldose 1-epimerase
VVPSGEQIELARDGQLAVVVEVGGGLRSYDVSGRAVLDGYPLDAMCTSGRGQVLIPWPNRLQDGRYDFDGRSHQLPLTEPGKGNAIHGLVRWEAWSPVEQAADRVVMEHVIRPQPGYPFTVALRIEYALSQSGLSVRTTADNLGDVECPFGSGAHPYLTVGTATVDPVILCVPGRTVIRSDERGIPVDRISVDGSEYDFRRPQAIGNTKLDHAFTDLERGADGAARVELVNSDTGAGVALWVDDGYRYVMIFTGDTLPDVNRRSLAVEPMTCPPNAYRSGEALIRLAPGQSFASAWGIAVLGNEA